MPRKHPRVTFATTGDSRTKQAFTAECNVNNIMRRFQATGVVEHLNQYPRGYGDFTSAPSSYHEAVNQVLKAQEMFSTIPAAIRRRFNNDPGEYLAFVQDPRNVDELVALGLAKKRADPQAQTPEERPAQAPKEPSPPNGGA